MPGPMAPASPSQTPSTTHVSFATVRMEPQFMLLGQSAGVVAALTALNTSRAAVGRTSMMVPPAVHDVDLKTLHAALLEGKQILALGPPPARTSYGCVSGLCIQLATGGGSGKNSSTCAGTPCFNHTLGVLQWLVVPKHFNTPTAHPGGLWSITAVIDTHIKKSEVLSGLLPPGMQAPVPAGTVLTLRAKPKPSVDIYVMITCTPAGCPAGH